MGRSVEGDTSDAPPGNRAGTAHGDRPKGRPGRKPKGSVPLVVAEVPEHPDPNHVLTWRQRKVLEVIRDSVERRGYPPSMREIGEAVGLASSSSVAHQLATLERKGFLRRDANRPRAVEVFSPEHLGVRRRARIDGNPSALTRPSPDATYVPVVGRIAAGGPDPRRASDRRSLPAPPTARRRRQPLPLEGRRRLDDRRCYHPIASGSRSDNNRSLTMATSSRR